MAQERTFTYDVPWIYHGAKMWPLVNEAADKIRNMGKHTVLLDDAAGDSDWIGFTAELKLPKVADISTPHGYLIHACDDGTAIIPVAIESRSFLRHVLQKFHDLYEYGQISPKLVAEILVLDTTQLQEDMTEREQLLLDDAAWDAHFKKFQMMYWDGVGR